MSNFSALELRREADRRIAGQLAWSTQRRITRASASDELEAEVLLLSGYIYIKITTKKKVTQKVTRNFKRWDVTGGSVSLVV